MVRHAGAIAFEPSSLSAGGADSEYLDANRMVRSPSTRSYRIDGFEQVNYPTCGGESMAGGVERTGQGCCIGWAVFRFGSTAIELSLSTVTV